MWARDVAVMVADSLAASQDAYLDDGTENARSFALPVHPQAKLCPTSSSYLTLLDYAARGRQTARTPVSTRTCPTLQHVIQLYRCNRPLTLPATM